MHASRGRGQLNPQIASVLLFTLSLLLIPSYSSSGPKALEWLKDKIEEAILLRERFADFNDDTTNPDKYPIQKTLFEG